MPALTGVSNRYEGEVPTALELDELLEAMKLLLNTTGLPTTAIPWPLVAQGNINMNGYSILNVGSISGIVNVNAAVSLQSAVSTINSLGYGKIIIAPGFTASTTTGGLEITADNVTVEGGLGASIDVVDRSTSGDGLKLSGDNIHLIGLKFTSSGVGTNIVNGVSLNGNARCKVTDCLFDGVYGDALALTRNGTVLVESAVIENNRFENVVANCITIYGCNGTQVVGNSAPELPASKALIRFDLSGALPSLDNTIARNTMQSTGAVSYGIRLFTAGPALISSRIVENTFTAPVAFLSNTGSNCNIDQNMFDGDVTVQLSGGSFSGNDVTGDLTMSTVSGARVTDNSLEAGISASGCTNVALCDNTISQSLDMTTIPGVVLFVGNTCLSNVTNLRATTTVTFGDNYVAGSIT